MGATELTNDEFQLFQEFIYTASGIRIPDAKRVLLSNRIRRRLKAGGFPGYKDYFRFLTSNAGREEVEGFLDAVTTNETFFFRTEKHFEWFSQDFISERLQQAIRGERPRQLRVLSAACSTGEEPYSLAICLLRNRLRLRDWKLEVVGTDISEQALQSAREAVYGERALELLDSVQRRRYFEPDDDKTRFRIRPAVRELVALQRHNLMEPMRPPLFDCVFLRNVLIYFDRKSKAQVIGHLVNALVRGGYLVIGPSEGIFDMLGMLTRHSPFLYQKP